jgi:hypothetical protein
MRTRSMTACCEATHRRPLPTDDATAADALPEGLAHPWRDAVAAR